MPQSTTSTLKIIPGRSRRDLLITAPARMDGHIKLTIPEFYGQSQGHPFAVDQVLAWESVPENGHAEFTLDTLPSEVGIDCHGSVSEREPDSLDLELYVSNVMQGPVEDAHHTAHLDMSTMPAFQDPAGERSYVFTNTGWLSLARLLEPVEDRPASVWVGATYGEHTVIWRVVARMSTEGSLVVALALDKGYALAGDHPDWPKGLLGGCRWGTLAPDEERLARGRIYFCEGGLDELRERYARDFRPA